VGKVVMKRYVFHYPTKRNSTVVPIVKDPVAVRVSAVIPFDVSLSEKIMIDPGDKVRTVSEVAFVGVQEILIF
jgi:hypothetical protein